MKVAPQRTQNLKVAGLDQILIRKWLQELSNICIGLTFPSSVFGFAKILTLAY